ncbi:type VII secretion protein EssA [Streptococcus suis]|nr:type VII secretion protein EssA [Streptococcus suis]
MKKLGIIFFLALFSLMTRTVIFANDGSLRIDTSLNQKSERTEIQYFEQENDLMRLFRPEIDKLVDTIQETDREAYQSDKSSLFVEKVEVKSIVNDYQPLLFTPETMIKSNDTYGVSLSQKKSSISLQMILLFIGGLLVMIYSIVAMKRKNHKA